MATTKFLLIPVLGISLAACSDDPEPFIVDGPKSARFNSDLAECEQLSLQREGDKGAATGGAIVGGLIGGAEADDGDALEGALVGAVIGGVVGSAEGNSKTEEQRNRIVFNCMRGRGHNVVG